MDTSRSTRPDTGYTVIEVIVAVAILAILMGALTALWGFGFSTTSNTTNHLRASNDAQVVSAFFTTDVRSALSTTVPACGPSGAQLALGGPSNSQTAYTKQGTNLVRSVCSPTKSTIVARNLSSFSVTCDGGACSTTATQFPDVVAITINEIDGARFTISAVRRATPLPSGLSSFSSSALLILGRTCPAVAASGNGTLVVTADAYVDGGSSSCPAVQGGSQITVNGSLFIQNSSCSGCAYQQVSQPEPDPYASLPIPDEAGMHRYSSTSYSGPGVYTNTVSLGSDTTFAPGVYVFEKGISISNGTIRGNGVLWFNGCGLNPTLTIPAPSTPCTASTGSVSASGHATLTLCSGTPQSPATTPAGQRYSGVVLFQSPADTATLSFAGQSATQASVSGVLYAPSATVALSGNPPTSAGLGFSSIVAGAVTVSGSPGTQINVGPLPNQPAC